MALEGLMRVPVSAFAVRMGVVMPGDDIAELVAEASRGLIEDGDVVCVTEAVVARSQGRYVSCDELALELRDKMRLEAGAKLGVVYPIASRNRFDLVLRAIGMATRGGTVRVLFPIPCDEVGNQLLDEDFAELRLELKALLRRLWESKGAFNGSFLRVLLSALLLQERGYKVLGSRWLRGSTEADLLLEDGRGERASLFLVQDGGNRLLPRSSLPPVSGRLMMAFCDPLGGSLLLRDGDSGEIVLSVDFADRMGELLDDRSIYPRELSELRFLHPITGVDYRDLYERTISSTGARAEIVFSNDPLKVVEPGDLDGIVLGEVHNREKRRKLFASLGLEAPILTLDQVGPPPWGVIGSNVADYGRGLLKLLPADADEVCDRIVSRVFEVCGKRVDALIFGDGAYKDPDTGIYELADPYPAIGVCRRLRGAGLRSGKKLKLAIDTLRNQGYSREEIERMTLELREAPSDLGTTPRRLASILASIADLLAGSADQATPVVVIRGIS